MTVENATPIDLDKNLFSVLGFLTVDVSTPYWTHVADVDEAGALGVTFSFMPDKNKDDDRIPADFSVLDVTRDPAEPDISALTEDDAADFDDFIKEEITTILASQGETLKRWMGSQLNDSRDERALMTAYIVNADGIERQYVSARRRFADKNILLLGSFDVELADEFLPRIMQMLGRVRAVTYSS